MNRRPDDIRGSLPRASAARVDAEVAAKFSEIKAIIGHPGDFGALIEAILREAIRPRLSERLEVGTGYLRDRAWASPQADILIYDKWNRPPLFAEGHVVLVNSEDTAVVGEVKSDLRRHGLSGLGHVAWFAKRCRYAHTVLFGYDNWKTLSSFKGAVDKWVRAWSGTLFNRDRTRFYAPELIIAGGNFFAVSTASKRPSENDDQYWEYHIYETPKGLNSSGAGMLAAFVNDWSETWRPRSDRERFGPGFPSNLLSLQVFDRDRWVLGFDLGKPEVLRFARIAGMRDLAESHDVAYVDSGRLELRLPERVPFGGVPQIDLLLDDVARPELGEASISAEMRFGTSGTLHVAFSSASLQPLSFPIWWRVGHPSFSVHHQFVVRTGFESEPSALPIRRLSQVRKPQEVSVAHPERIKRHGVLVTLVLPLKTDKGQACSFLRGICSEVQNDRIILMKCEGLDQNRKRLKGTASGEQSFALYWDQIRMIELTRTRRKLVPADILEWG